MWFNLYYLYNDYFQFLWDFQVIYLICLVIVMLGNFNEGRFIIGIYFWGSFGKGKKFVVIFYSIVYVCEWIIIMVNEYLVFNFLIKYDIDVEIKSFVDKYDFYVFFVVNFDGFVFIQINICLWCKNC